MPFGLGLLESALGGGGGNRTPVRNAFTSIVSPTLPLAYDNITNDCDLIQRMAHSTQALLNTPSATSLASCILLGSCFGEWLFRRYVFRPEVWSVKLSSELKPATGFEPVVGTALASRQLGRSALCSDLAASRINLSRTLG